MRPAVHIAAEALQHVARYDAMRLQTYRDQENLADRSRISAIGSTLALRFDDVGYFNRVYCFDDTWVEALPEIEEFYGGGPFGCTLITPPSDGPDGACISRAGWVAGHQYAWLHHPNCGSIRSDRQTSFDIRAPKSSEREQFLLTYLKAFEAQEDRVPAALQNMRHLFDRSELHFLMAWHKGILAGVGIWMRCDEAALLCAGAALPKFREMGCHAALLAARIALAADAGCRQIYSWAELGGQSHANMVKAGLEAVGTTLTWCYSPENV